MFLGLQALRFFAATSVALYHAIHYALLMEIVPSDWIDHSPTILSSGVTVFFALSGFLMAKMAEELEAATVPVAQAIENLPAISGGDCDHSCRQVPDLGIGAPV